MAAVDVERVGWGGEGGGGGGVRVPDVGSVRCTRWYTVDCIVANTLVDKISCTRRLKHSVPKLHFCKVLRAGSWCVWLQRPAVLVEQWCERRNIDRVTACSWLSFRFTCGCPSGLASNQGTGGRGGGGGRYITTPGRHWQQLSAELPQRWALTDAGSQRDQRLLGL